MSKVEKLFNRVLMFMVFVSAGARLAVARIFPPPQLDPKPPAVKVFALSEAAWLELRTVSDGPNQEKKGSDDKKESPKSSDSDKDTSKSSDTAKSQSKSDCDKDSSKSQNDSKGAAPSGEKQRDASQNSECGPGGGDGDTGGSGG